MVVAPSPLPPPPGIPLSNLQRFENMANWFCNSKEPVHLQTITTKLARAASLLCNRQLNTNWNVPYTGYTGPSPTPPHPIRLYVTNRHACILLLPFWAKWRLVECHNSEAMNTSLLVKFPMTGNALCASYRLKIQFKSKSAVTGFVRSVLGQYWGN